MCYILCVRIVMFARTFCILFSSDEMLKFCLAPCSQIRDVDPVQILAIFKSKSINIFYGVADGDGGQSAAALECAAADGGDGVGDGHRGQAAAAVECVPANRCDGVGDGHRGQSAAATECAAADGGAGVRCRPLPGLPGPD